MVSHTGSGKNPNDVDLKIFWFVVDFKEENDGNSPTIMEISQACKIPYSSVHWRLKSLERQGLITRPAGKSSRIVVRGGKWQLDPHLGLITYGMKEGELPQWQYVGETSTAT